MPRCYVLSVFAHVRAFKPSIRNFLAGIHVTGLLYSTSHSVAVTGSIIALHNFSKHNLFDFVKRQSADTPRGDVSIDR